MSKILIDGPDIHPFTAHDIRKLKPCVLCGNLGYLPYMLVIASGHAHGSCVVSSMTHEEILALPLEESKKLRLNQTGVDLMRKLVDNIILKNSDRRAKKHGGKCGDMGPTMPSPYEK